MATFLVEDSMARVSKDAREVDCLGARGEGSHGKVLILATDIFTRSGIARYTSALASALGGMLGPENVDVLPFFDWGYTGQVPDGFGVSRAVSRDLHAGVLSRLHFVLKAMRAGLRRYDLVIANHVALAPIAALMKGVFGTPYWVACHSVEIWWGTSRWNCSALKGADLILPVSEYTADVVRKIEGIKSERVKVIYNAIPDSFAELLSPQQSPSEPEAGDKREARFVLSVCNLVPGNEFKGVDTVIRAWPRVLKELPSLRYVVAGEGAIRAKLEKLAIETGVASSVAFTGEISDAELAGLYRGCEAFVLPSRGQKQRGAFGGEGFGRVYVEAAMAGKPVVGSRSGGATEAVVAGTTGFLVEPDSVAEVADALLAILRDQRLAQRMGAAARRWALDTFSENALSDSLSECLGPFGFNRQVSRTMASAGGQL
jgi:phosphatidyl-myo-inositol dimannoside synthase